MQESLHGAVLVTGGAKRIGQAICRRVAAAGASPVVHARSSLDAAKTLAQELGGATVQADLSKPDAVATLLADAAEAAGQPIRYVVNNASAFPQMSLGEASYADLDKMMRLHAWAPLELARSLHREGGEAVVNLLDTRVASHDPKHFPYHMSKQMLWQLTRTLAKELAPLRVNGVAPGPILAPTDGSGEEAMQAAIDATVLGRAGTQEEIAEAVAFLLGHDYITGNVLWVDGGRHLRR